jgi:tetratricopeptide (TPR) repeat protein
MMAAEAFDKGNKAYEQKDYNAAIIHYNETIRLDPNYASAYHNRGYTKYALNDLKSAIDDYNEAIRLGPNDADTYINRGVAKYALNDEKGAIDDYNEAIRLNPNDDVAYNNRGLAKAALNDHKGAIDDYNEAIRINPNYASAYRSRGLAKSALNDHKGAIEDFDHALRINPNDALAKKRRKAAMLALKDDATSDLKEVAPLGNEVVDSTPVTQHVDLPVAASGELSTCSVCQTAFFFDYKEDRLIQREAIYGDLAKAVRNIIAHDRTHHAHSHISGPPSVDGKASTSRAPTTCSDTSQSAADGAPRDAEQCNWRYGSGVVVPESVSNVCFGTIPQAMHKFTPLEDITDHIVDKDSARHLYEQYDSKTKMLNQVRRSDRMIDESMNRHDFDATPVLLHCGHTVCRGCAYQCVRAHENAKYDTMFAMVNCPTRCNRQTAFVCDLGVEWLPIDVHRIRLLQKQRKPSGKPMCSEHKDRIATVRCTHAVCVEFPLMCAECDQAEHSGRKSSKHVRVEPSHAAAAGVSVSTDALCSIHQQPLTGVCVTDGTPGCGECLYDHIGHDVKRLHEVCSDWSTKLETLQRETLIRAHVLSDRAASVQTKFDEMMQSINTRFDTVVNSANIRRNKLAFEARRWRKIQLEASKILAAESSKLSATAMYERMLLQRVLDPEQADSKSKSSSKSKTSSASSSSVTVTVPDAVLGSVARQAQASGSAIEAQSVELNTGIAAMQAKDMHVTFDNANHASVLNTIQCMGTVTVDPANIAI